MIFAMIPEDAKQLVQFKSKKSILQLIPPENLPEYMPGACGKQNYRLVPSNHVLPLKELFKDRLAPAALSKIQEYCDHWQTN